MALERAQLEERRRRQSELKNEIRMLREKEEHERQLREEEERRIRADEEQKREEEEMAKRFGFFLQFDEVSFLVIERRTPRPFRQL